MTFLYTIILIYFRFLLQIDAFVVIACPENEVFDSRDFLKPMLTPYEVELAFNTAREFCLQYFMDFRQILPGGSHYVNFKSSTDSDISLINSSVRNCEDDTSCTDQMNALTIRSSGRHIRFIERNLLKNLNFF